MIRVSVDQNAIRKRLAKIEKQGGDLNAPMHAIGETIASSVQKNFQVGGRFSSAGDWRGGTSKWKESKAAVKRGGQTLRKSGQLMNSISHTAKDSSVEIGTNKPYAAAMNFGVDKDVNVKEHERRIVKRGRKRASGKTTVRSHERKMNLEARPFMVVQEQDIEECIEILDNHILKE